MICYRDRTFCSQPLEDCSCHESRKITPEVMKAAKEWWGDFPVKPTFAIGKLCSGKVVPLRKT